MTDRDPGTPDLADLSDPADLGALVDLVLPADEFPSGSAAGGVGFLRSYLAERPDLRPRLDGLRAAADPTGHPDWDWFAELVNAGFYADPANGGNADAVSWRMVDWAPDPGGGWSRPVPVPEAEPLVVTPDRLASRYDAVVIGSGAGGGVAACLLAESGRRVLVVEAGSWPTIAELSRDQLRNPRSDWGVLPLSGPLDERDLRVLEIGDRAEVLRPYEPGWANNAMTAGGGTRVYGAQAWRFGPQDLAMASTYGVPEGSALADWPIGYDDLEPCYARADRELGVSGSSAGETIRRSTRYPLPPVRTGPRHELLRAAAERLGWGTVRVPLLINSAPYGGRGACEGCRMCVGFACPTDAKNGSQNTVLPRAFATGRAEILLQSRAERLVVHGRGRVVGVRLVGRDAAGKIWRTGIGAGEVVVSGGAVESARLLLNSAHDREPTGLGNGHDQVGRHLQGHVYGGAVGIFDDLVEDLVGPGPTISTHDFRHGVPGLVGGGVLVDEFIPLPANVYRSLSAAGLIPRWGAASKRGMRDLLRRSLRVMGPIQEVTSAESRVRVDDAVRDAYGVPVPRLSGAVHACDRAAQGMLAERAVEWLNAAGATRTAAMVGTGEGPSAGQHQAGTCRMGADPATSVVDPWCRVWGHDNVRVVDASVHVTNGGVNPVLTVFANAYRVLDEMTR
jgi:choline dehydrogenase-like flavoprotein